MRRQKYIYENHMRSYLLVKYRIVEGTKIIIIHIKNTKNYAWCQVNARGVFAIVSETIGTSNSHQ